MSVTVRFCVEAINTPPPTLHSWREPSEHAYTSSIQFLERTTYSSVETKIPIGETDLLGFVAVAMTFETRWRRIERIGGAEIDFWFETYLEVRKWLRALEHITKHFEQASH